MVSIETIDGNRSAMRLAWILVPCKGLIKYYNTFS